MVWWEWVIVGGVIWLVALGLLIAFLRGAHVDEDGGDSARR
jgi:hypothetical protein